MIYVWLCAVIGGVISLISNLIMIRWPLSGTYANLFDYFLFCLAPSNLLLFAGVLGNGWVALGFGSFLNAVIYGLIGYLFLKVAQGFKWPYVALLIPLLFLFWIVYQLRQSPT